VIARHLADYLRRTDPLAKTIVFCIDQPHAEQMRDALTRAAAELVARYPGYVERIVADEGAEGKRVLGRFSLPDELMPAVVTTSRLLTTGVDVPTCKNIVLARPVNSMVEFKQIIGRGTRLHEPGKLWFTILDYAGATRLFFDPDFDGDPELVEVEPLIPRPATEATTVDTVGPTEPPTDDQTEQSSTNGATTSTRAVTRPPATISDSVTGEYISESPGADAVVVGSDTGPTANGDSSATTELPPTAGARRGSATARWRGRGRACSSGSATTS
jgi:type I site-specific restriction endonuclease